VIDHQRKPESLERAPHGCILSRPCAGGRTEGGKLGGGFRGLPLSRRMRESDAGKR
jgi:hypothetical protein